MMIPKHVCVTLLADVDKVSRFASASEKLAHSMMFSCLIVVFGKARGMQTTQHRKPRFSAARRCEGAGCGIPAFPTHYETTATSE